MTTYKPGEILLLDYPYTTGGQAKSRPVLVLLDSGDADILVAKMSTKPARTQFDIAIQEWRNAGLKAPSLVRLDKLLTTEKSLIRLVIGSLSASDRKSVGAVLATLFSGW